jgi:hypothetical protein
MGIITAISSANGYRNPTSPKQLLVHPWPKKFISKGHKTIQLVIKSICAQNTKEARACAPVENVEKAHMRPMRDCGRKKPRIAQNNTFMILFSLPPTSGSSPKSI